MHREIKGVLGGWEKLIYSTSYSSYNYNLLAPLCGLANYQLYFGVFCLLSQLCTFEAEFKTETSKLGL